MRTKLIIIAAVLQLAVVVFMAAQREAVLRFGRTVYLRTMPVDPRDIFRGDYVRLSYEVSQLPVRAWQDDLKHLTNNTPKELRQLRDLRVYSVLEPDGEGLGELRYVTGRRPSDGLFIRGRTDRLRPGGMNVRYGLEAFFVQQGKGLELERGRTREDRMRVAMEMEVAVGMSGMAVIKGYRWCPLGLGLNIATNAERRPVAATLTLLNASEKPLAIVDLPGGRSFSLEHDFWGWQISDDAWAWVGESSTPPPISDEHVIVLQPDEQHDIRIKFDDPAWFVQQPGGEPASLTEPERRRWQRFRFVYRPPSRELSAHLRDAELLWHGRLHSSAFIGANVD